LMLRIAEAVAKVKGNVKVTGHSDNQRIATLRFPSNWALSQARAEEVKNLLAARTGQPERFTAQGLSDTGLPFLAPEPVDYRPPSALFRRGVAVIQVAAGHSCT